MLFSIANRMACHFHAVLIERFNLLPALHRPVIRKVVITALREASFRSAHHSATNNRWKLKA